MLVVKVAWLQILTSSCNKWTTPTIYVSFPSVTPSSRSTKLNKTKEIMTGYNAHTIKQRMALCGRGKGVLILATHHS
jgi:hypothetical protein